ncbi:MAG: Flp pilus assembly protein CpaB [Chloroflexi bacterium]|nr:Flp pilus assembly protein CpaB [Chloroflexota bacterium]
MRGIRLVLILLIAVILVAVVVLVLLPQLQPSAPPPAADPGVAQVTPAPEVTLPPSPTPIQFIELVVAVQELPRGFRIPPDAVVVAPFPEASAPVNVITDVEDVIGRVARTDIFREQPILSNMIVDDLTNLARVGSDAAAILPSNLVAVSLPINRLTSVAYAVQDGDRVDLIISLLYVDIDEEFQSLLPNQIALLRPDPETGQLVFTGESISGRPDNLPPPLGTVFLEPSERARPRLVTQRTIQDAFVVHVGNFPPNGRFIGVPPTPTPLPVEEEEDEGTPPPPTPTPPRPDIITLGVTPQDAVIISWMIEARIPVTLALRSATDTSRVATNQVTLDYVMNEYGIDVPGRRDFSIEPAIRSIRQIVVGEEISLGENTQ